MFQDFSKELSRVYLEKEGQELDPQLVTAAPDSVEDLISEMSSSDQHLDLRSFLLKTKAMVRKYVLLLECYLLNMIILNF